MSYRMSDDERAKGMARLERGFMTPRVFFAESGAMVSVETEDGGTDTVEAEYDEDGTGEPLAAGWFCELSASGYMDRTGYAGPFSTEAAAEEYLIETYGDDGDDCADAEA